MNGRRDGRVRTEDGVGQFEEGVAPGVEALVERAAEALESIGRFHDAPIMHPPPAFRTPYLPAGLKRKLRTPALVVPTLGASAVGRDVLLGHRSRPDEDRARYIRPLAGYLCNSKVGLRAI